MKTSANEEEQCHIVAIPYPGRGHINPMLNLCKLILSKSKHVFVKITFVVTQEWHTFLTSESHYPLTIFNFAVLPQVIPSEIGRATDFPGFVEAVLTKLQAPFEELLDQLEMPPTTIVNDLVMGWVVDLAKRRNVPVASLVTYSASHVSVLAHFELLVQHGHFPLDVSERGHEVVDYIPGLPTTTIADLPTIFEGNGNKVLHRILESLSTTMNNAQYLLFTSFYEFEEQVMNCLKAKIHPPVYHIGPMIPYFKLTEIDGENQQSYFNWLDSQPNGSVLYIAQGSFLSASSDQVREIIAGVRESNVRYLWVTRDDSSKFKDGHDSDNNSSSNKGMLVPWCDQLRVLCHPSIGGFWTHCGWNSTLEGIYAGVPMLTYPIFWDQFPNSKLVVSDMKIGWRVTSNDRLRKGELSTRHEIAQLVSKFMDQGSGERIEMVRRAKGLQGNLRKAIANGGSAASDFDVFLSNILPFQT